MIRFLIVAFFATAMPAQAALKQVFVRTVPKMAFIGGVKKYFKPNVIISNISAKKFCEPLKPFSFSGMPKSHNVIIDEMDRLEGEGEHVSLSNPVEYWRRGAVAYFPEDRKRFPKLYEVVEKCSKALRWEKEVIFKIKVLYDVPLDGKWAVGVAQPKLRRLYDQDYYYTTSPEIYLNYNYLEKFEKLNTDELAAFIVRSAIYDEYYRELSGKVDLAEPKTAVYAHLRDVERAIDEKTAYAMQSADPLISLIEMAEEPCANKLMQELGCNDFECVNERRSVSCPETRIEALKVIKNNTDSKKERIFEPIDKSLPPFKY